jgi:cell division inhibitor SepF
VSSDTWWNRTLVYLGLKEEPDEAYDEVVGSATGADERASGAGLATERSRGDVTVRQLRPSPGADEGASSASVRAAVVEIGDFEDVESVGARYRTGQPVVFDASTSDPSTARRVVDFVSGMTYVSRGSLSKVGSRAFLLVPDGVHLPDDERRRLAGLGYRVTGSGA